MTQLFHRRMGCYLNQISKTLSQDLKHPSVSCSKHVRMIANNRRDPHKRSFPRNFKPDYDLTGTGPIAEGQVIIKPPEPNLTAFQKVDDPHAFQYVEKILPRKTVPDIPKHASYPTPSGWIPPKDESLELPYHVKRNKFHHFPISLEVFDGGTRKMTCIKNIHGDIWGLELELRKILEEKYQKPMFTQVDEVCAKLRIRGNFMEDVSDFLIEKGL